MRDVLFVGMPQLVDAGPLTRNSLTLGTKETFFYLASFLNLPNQMTWPAGGLPGSGIAGMVQKAVGAISNTGVTMEEWNAAFGPELGMLGDWPNGTQWPALIATVPVKDSAKAGQLFTKMTTGPDGTSSGTRGERGSFLHGSRRRNAVLDYADNCVVGQTSRRRHDGRRRGRSGKTKFECCFGISVFGNISRGRARCAVG